MKFSARALIAPLLFVTFAFPARPSDHREAPLIRQDLPADIADVYAFLNPVDPSRLVLAMTVNPFSVRTEGTTYNFSENVRYRFNIDTDGDALADNRLFVTFEGAGTDQRFKVEAPGFSFTGPVTAPTQEPTPNAPVVTQGPFGMLAFAGPRDDPFFFDVVGFDRFLAGTGTFSGADGFAGFNVSAIVLEMPVGLVDDGSTSLGIWGDTQRRRFTLRRSREGELEVSAGKWEQVDRAGNPGVNTALIPSGMKDLYNIAGPELDAGEFAPDIVATLQALGTDQTNINILASVAVPDTLKLDLTQPVGYPNGRDLDDDVIDTLLFFIFNQTPVSDGAQANDVAFANSFPYLAPPFQAL